MFALEGSIGGSEPADVQSCSLTKMALVLWALERGLVEIWPLKEHFLDIYGIACANDALVAAHLELSSGSTKLNMSFVRAAHD